MKYMIPKTNVPVFHRALLCLGKIGSELFFEPGQDSLVIKTINSARTCFCVITFESGFFTSIEGTDASSTSSTSSTSGQMICVHMRSLLLPFKSVHLTEKSVEACLVQLSQDCDKVLIEKYCKYEVTQTCSLPRVEYNDTIKMEYVQRGRNHWSVQQKVLSDVVGAFLPSQDEVVMKVTPERFHVKNYVETYENKEQTHTDYSLHPEEFTEYAVQEDTALVMTLKEFRSIICFSDSIGLPVTATFGQGGDPIAFTIHQPALMKVYCVLSTIVDDTPEEDKPLKTPKSKIPGSQHQRSSIDDKRSAQTHSTQRDNIAPVLIAPPSATPIRGAPPTTNPIRGAGDSSVHRTTARTEIGNSSPNQSDLLQDMSGVAELETSLPVQPNPRPNIFGKCFDRTYNPASESGRRVRVPDSDPDTDTEDR